jgi:hypothetical protein
VKANCTAKHTIRKYMGNDAHSWALFCGGRPILTGLSKAEASYYLRKAKEGEH